MIAPMSKNDTRREFDAGYRYAKFKSRWDAIGRAFMYGTIIAIAIFYQTAWWKRVIGALLAFWLVGVVVQYRAIRRERAEKSGAQT